MAAWYRRCARYVGHRARPAGRHTGAMVARRRRRWWWIGAGAVVVAAGAFVIVRFVLLHDTTTALGPDEAIARYRASSTVATSVTSGAPTALTLPTPGVYRYA